MMSLCTRHWLTTSAGMFGGVFAWMHASVLGTAFPPDLIGFGVSAVAMVLVTLLTQKINAPRPLTDIEGNPIDLVDRVSTFRSGKSYSS